MNLKKSTLATAVAGVLALGAASNASASVYAGSSLLLQDLFVITYDGNTISPQPVTTFQFTTTNTATLNGVSAPTSSATCNGTPAANNCNGTSPRLDAGPANAPGGTINRANNDFSFFGPGLDQYSNSDSAILTSQLTGDTSTSTGQVAESEIQDAPNASANAEIQSTTGFRFAFSINDIGGLDLLFRADPALRVAIDEAIPQFLNGSAQANVNFTASLSRNSDGSDVTWSPQGSDTNDCNVDSGLTGVTCVEGRLDGQDADSIDLNRNLSTSSNPSDNSFSLAPGLGTFGIQIRGLQPGEYTFALNAVTSTTVQATRQQIPEPGTLALLGVGLLGIGAARFRKARA